MISTNKISKVKENLEATLSAAKDSDVPVWSILENFSYLLHQQRDFVDAGIVANASLVSKANSILCEKARQVSMGQHEISHR